HRSVALLGSLSVVIECLALGEGPPGFRPGFTCPTLLGYRFAQLPWSPTRLSPAPVPFSNGLRLTVAVRLIVGPTTPAASRRRFRRVPLLSPLLGESRLLSLPPGTEMFLFPGCRRASRDQRSLSSSPEPIAAFHAHLF